MGFSRDLINYLLQGITSDLFPGITLPTPDYEHLNVAIYKTCKELNLQCPPIFLEKIQQVIIIFLISDTFIFTLIYLTQLMVFVAVVKTFPLFKKLFPDNFFNYFLLHTHSL